mmetsp:Transcript_19814/g.29224  ORF Transcript_19814/g.29224 Transcript_19814/m.29224 type:complete len:255 (+) Transcript_19814:107-871(+)
MTERFDAQDPKWSVSNKFKPDKGESWKHPPESDGWTLSHNSLRGEMNDISAAMHALNDKYPEKLPGWAVLSLIKIWKTHQEHMLSHHENEEKIVSPFMAKRCLAPAEIMGEEHGSIVDKLKKITSDIEKLHKDVKLSHIIALVEDYQTNVLHHFENEERISLLLLRAYFTPKEVKLMVLKISLLSKKVEVGSLVHYMSEDAFRSVFMKQEQIPGFVWTLTFGPKYKWFLRNMVEPLEAMKEGLEPVVDTGCCGK